MPSGMARQTLKNGQKLRNLFSQLSIAYQTASNRFKPDLTDNSSSIGQAGSGYESPDAQGDVTTFAFFAKNGK